MDFDITYINWNEYYRPLTLEERDLYRSQEPYRAFLTFLDRYYNHNRNNPPRKLLPQPLRRIGLLGWHLEDLSYLQLYMFMLVRIMGRSIMDNSLVVLDHDSLSDYFEFNLFEPSQMIIVSFDQLHQHFYLYLGQGVYIARTVGGRLRRYNSIYDIVLSIIDRGLLYGRRHARLLAVDILPWDNNMLLNQNKINSNN